MGPPASTTTVAPVALNRAKSTSAISQLKKGIPPESVRTIRLGGEGLVDATVAKSQMRFWPGMPARRIAESIAVDIVEHTAFQPGEPVENGYFHQITTAIWRATATVAFHCTPWEAKYIQGFVPDTNW